MFWLHFVGNCNMPKRIFSQLFTYHFPSIWYLPLAEGIHVTPSKFHFINLPVLVELNTRKHDVTMHSGIFLCFCCCYGNESM